MFPLHYYEATKMKSRGKLLQKVNFVLNVDATENNLWKEKSSKLEESILKNDSSSQVDSKSLYKDL